MWCEHTRARAQIQISGGWRDDRSVWTRRDCVNAMQQALNLPNAARLYKDVSPSRDLSVHRPPARVRRREPKGTTRGDRNKVLLLWVVKES